MTKAHPFRFGVLCERMASAQELINKARLTEHLGYSTFLIRDHWLQEPFGDQLAPLIALMTVANATKTLRIGSMVLCNDYHHPVLLAKETATLDLLSNGRFELGIGAGWLRDEYERAGMPFDAPGVRVSRLAEALQVLKGLFANGSFTFSGTHYTVTNLNGFPKPHQHPHPPILIGGGSKRILALAAREATTVGILTRALHDGTISEDPMELLPETMIQKVEWVRQAAGERYKELELSMIITPLFTQYQRQRAEQLIYESRWSGISTEQVLSMPSYFIGTLKQTVEQIQQRREQYGFSYFVVSDSNMETFAPIVAELSGK